MKILIYGAGVIGQIYAARLHQAGHDVTVFARHQTCETLARDGITLVNAAPAKGAPVKAAPASPIRVDVTGHLGSDRSFELVLVTVRRDQVEDVLPTLSGLQAGNVVMMQNDALDLPRVADIVGRDRTFFGFPGVGGYRRDDGAVCYLDIPQQPTTLGQRGGQEERVAEVFKSAGFAVATTDDMQGWLKTHGVFIAAMCASINSCGGDAVKLAADRERVATMITAVGEGFRALAKQGVEVQPRPLKTIFTRVPRVFAIRYWQGQLRGPVGTVSLAPHSRATKDTELPVLYRDVQKMLDGTSPAPHLDKLLSAALLLCRERGLRVHASGGFFPCCVSASCSWPSTTPSSTSPYPRLTGGSTRPPLTCNGSSPPTRCSSRGSSWWPGTSATGWAASGCCRSGWCSSRWPPWPRPGRPRWIS
jgi:2-dehydropantoate 2-reductase